MGWFSNAVKNLRPDRVLKDPKKVVQSQLDPAGFVVRSGRGQEMPGTARSLFDPGGFFDGRDPVKYPSYTPTGQLRLSENAQKLYDQMKARSAARAAARAAGQQYQPPQGAVVQQQAAPVKPGRVMMRPPGKNFYADGGQVCDEHSKSTSKVINRKPNGKPY